MEEFYDVCTEGTLRLEVANMMERTPFFSKLKGDKWFEVEDAICDFIKNNEEKIAENYLNKIMENYKNNK